VATTISCCSGDWLTLTTRGGLGPNLTPNILLQFINAEGNVLLTLSGSTPVPSSLISLLLELDINLPTDRQGLVIDHFNYDTISASEKHEVLLLPTPGPLRSDYKDFFSLSSSDGRDGQAGGAEKAASAVIAFPNGMGQTLGSGALLAPILRAPATSYSYNPKEQAETVDDLFASGSQLSLVSTLQGRNSARFTVVGSADMLSDKWFDAKVKKIGEKDSVKTLNREFAKAVSGWTFKETGVLRVNWVEHHLNEVGHSNASNPNIYRIKNDVVRFIPIFHAHTVFSNRIRRILFHSLSIRGTSTSLSLSRRTMSCNSNSACFRLSTGSN
jgi:oligosaccharyltransferase complex subunit beta